jgi:hypothetical protein
MINPWLLLLALFYFGGIGLGYFLARLKYKDDSYEHENKDNS